MIVGSDGHRGTKVGWVFGATVELLAGCSGVGPWAVGRGRK